MCLYYNMPFKIVKQGEKYRLYNLEKKTFSKREFKTRKSAANMKNVYMKYDKQKKYVSK